MIETITTSAAAQVAGNASAAIATITAELLVQDEQAEALRAELAALQDELAEGQQRGAELTQEAAALRAELERCELAESMAEGTALAGQAAEATNRAREAWEAARAALQADAETWEPRQHAIAERLTFLQTSLDEGAALVREKQARMRQLQRVFASNHAQHGLDAQQALEAEFAALASGRQAALDVLAELDEQEALLRDQIKERLAEWPELARQSIEQHLVYEPSAWVQMLTHWQALATLAADHPKAIDAPAWSAYVASGTVPLWHLAQYGREGRDAELRQFNRMLGDLAALVERQENAGRLAQVEARIRA